MATYHNGDSPRDPVQLLIDYVRKSRLAVGDRLPSMDDLAAKWKLNRNIVRDAVLRAQTMGLVRVKPRSGTVVQSVNYAPLVDAMASTLQVALMQEDRNLLDLLEIRRMIEIKAAGRAAARRRLADLEPLREAQEAMRYLPNDYENFMRPNEEFHLAIAKISGNQVMVKLLRCLLELLRPVLAKRLQSRKDVASDRREHETIYRAILEGRPAQARAAMAEHLKETDKYLKPSPAKERNGHGKTHNGRAKSLTHASRVAL